MIEYSYLVNIINIISSRILLMHLKGTLIFGRIIIGRYNSPVVLIPLKVKIKI